MIYYYFRTHNFCSAILLVFFFATNLGKVNKVLQRSYNPGRATTLLTPPSHLAYRFAGCGMHTWMYAHLGHMCALSKTVFGPSMMAAEYWMRDKEPFWKKNGRLESRAILSP